jgi:hypothetical protein
MVHAEIEKEMRRAASAVGLLLVVTMETACYPVKAYHLADPTKPIANNITLSYIEFDDNGEMYDQLADPARKNGPLVRGELDAAIKNIQDLKASHKEGVNAVVFIHGWKNNAGDSNNVAGFQRFLEQIYASYATTPDPAPLIGIYIGWRGASTKIGKDLSYWDRTMAATRVAGPHLEEALYRIIRTVKGMPNEIDTSSKLIMIGHSFGGRVLEKAMTSYYESMMLAFDGNHVDGCVTPATSRVQRGTAAAGVGNLAGKVVIPDLTVLLNEAAPATDAKQFLEFLKCHGVDYRRENRDFPLFLSMTSDGDAATTIALPIGQAVASLQLKTREYQPADPPEITNQSTYFLHSAANIPALYSHELSKSACRPGSEVFYTSVGGGYHLCEVPLPGNAKPDWNRTPYWIFHIPVSIVPDHSDIFHPELYGFLSYFFPPAAAMHKPSTPTIRSLSIQ